MAQDRPTADHREKRPPTQSAKGKIRSGATPKAAAASGAAVTATRRDPAPGTVSIQARAARALNRVSWVVKVLEATTTRVRDGSRPARAAVISEGSTLAAKRRSILGATGARASQTRRGPRSEPPMPMCRTASISPFRRISPAKARMRSRAVRTSSVTSWPRAAQGPASGARRAMCRTARPSEAFTGAPANRAWRAAERSAAATRSRARAKLACDQGCLDRSRARPQASKVRTPTLSGSMSKSRRRGGSAAADPASASQGSVMALTPWRLP